MAKERARSDRTITRVTITYRRGGEEQEHEIVLENTEGAAADSVSLSEELVRKLAYREGGEYREPRRERGRGWKLTSTESIQGNCIWIHNTDCSWSEICAPDT